MQNLEIRPDFGMFYRGRAGLFGCYGVLASDNHQVNTNTKKMLSRSTMAGVDAAP
jgi:hypothetical protein